MTNQYLGKAKSFLISLIYKDCCVATWKRHKGFIVTLRINKLTGTKKVVNQRYVMDTWKAAC